jgi:hypothetical protein
MLDIINDYQIEKKRVFSSIDDEKEKSAYMNYFMYVIKEHDLVLPLLKKIRGKTLMLQ